MAEFFSFCEKFEAEKMRWCNLRCMGDCIEIKEIRNMVSIK